MHDDDVEGLIQALQSMLEDSSLCYEPSEAYVIRTLRFESLRDAGEYIGKLSRIIPADLASCFHTLLDNEGNVTFKVLIDDPEHPEEAFQLSRILAPGDREPRH